jgi:hypothetical protein
MSKNWIRARTQTEVRAGGDVLLDILSDFKVRSFWVFGLFYKLSSVYSCVVWPSNTISVFLFSGSENRDLVAMHSEGEKFGAVAC